MKNIINTFLLFVAVLLWAGCAELEQVNPNQSTDASFWQTEEQMFQGLIGAYDQLQDGGMYGLDQRIYPVLLSDVGTNEAPWEFNDLARFTQDDLNQFETWWTANYGLIARAYQVIDRVPNVTGPNVAQYGAEAQFLAALGYFNLISGFGENIAYVNRIQEAEDKPRRAETGELWALTDSLLSTAIPNLPLVYNSQNYGRVTQGAAQALLAKVRMQQGDLAGAAPLLQDIISSGAFRLNENFEDNFLELNNVNPESLFTINFLHNGVESESDNHILHKFNSPGEWKSSYGDVQAQNTVVNRFQIENDVNGDQDIRMNATVFWEGSDRLLNGETHLAWFENAELFNPDVNTAIYKYNENEEVVANDNGGNALQQNGGKDYAIIRYADVLLLYAEVLNDAGQTTQAYEFVDMVRERANLRPLSETKPGMSQADFLIQLKHERFTELAGESWRHFDLKRWGDYGPGLANDVVLPVTGDVIPGDPNFETFTVGQDELFSIPQTELDLNANLTQNPGY